MKADRILEETQHRQAPFLTVSKKNWETEEIWKKSVMPKYGWSEQVYLAGYGWSLSGLFRSCRLVSKSGLTLASLHRPITKPNCNYTLIWQSMKEGADSNRFRQNYEEVFCTKGNGTRSLRVTIHCTGRMKSTQKVIVLLNLSTSRFLVRWKSIFCYLLKGCSCLNMKTTQLNCKIHKYSEIYCNLGQFTNRTTARLGQHNPPLITNGLVIGLQ